MTHDLIAFLRARLDEDEAVARQAARGPWSRDYHAAFMHGIKDADDRALIGGGLMESPNANHTVRHDPARVLAEVDARRIILDRYAEVQEMDREDAEPEYAYGRAVGLGEAVRQLALPYADHPDYREEWQP